jgi:hypothetical protein
MLNVGGKLYFSEILAGDRPFFFLTRGIIKASPEKSEKLL